MLRPIRLFSLKSDKYFLFFEASEVKLWKSGKIGPCNLTKMVEFSVLAAKISQLIDVGFFLVFVLTQKAINSSSDKSIFTQIR